MEEWELHKRIAYSIIRLFKSNFTSLLFGFMSAAFLISMWISNTATALMLLPIGLAVIKNIKTEAGIHKGILLGIAYGCSIGGIATIIGTPPNLVFQRIFKISFPDRAEVLFGEWIILVFPLALILLLITWVLLAKVFFKKDFEQSKNQKIEINEQLSKISYEEKVVIIVFSLTALLWIFRKDIILGEFVIPGWSGILTFADFVDDSTIATFMSVLLFIIPSKSNREKRILNSSSIKKLPWEIIILFGGGFALAEGFISSGLSKILGNQLSVLSNFPVYLLAISICLVITFLTELTSNTATAQIILPILAALSIELNINPLIVMIPAAISSSMAFMMPVATPPNAIIFSSKSITVYEMVRVGFFLNLIGAIAISTYFYFFLR
jgi:sodium-dependent dicarboxylate transporter 2/3/5